MAHQPHPRGRGEGQAAPLSAPATIAAVATPPGRGGIGVVRLSGPEARPIAEAIAGPLAQPRHARHAAFRDGDGGVIDEGLAIWFPGPASYTGEDVVELQGHGGPMVMRRLLDRCLALGAVLAQPGEFTRRAFLNDRIDLAQAEAVADLIDAASVEAARSAARSLTGDFSRRIGALVEALVELRLHVEACIDFPEEEIAPADRAWQVERLAGLRAKLDAVLDAAKQGVVLREGLTAVLVGRPNVGKSSLLNALAGDEVAIVTPIPGTTRDYVKATIALEGVPIHLVDTAGLRDAADEVERLGVERSWKAVGEAGAVLFVSDTDAGLAEDEALVARLPAAVPTLFVRNKVDLAPPRQLAGGEIGVSARTGDGLDGLRQWLLGAAGWQPHGEAVFMARARHLEALHAAGSDLAAAQDIQAFELKAENLRRAQQSLGAITGEVSADELLGRIFATFCIGK